MDRLAVMTTFVAVVDHQGFAAAARKLKLSAPAVTRQIAALEAELGVSLLQRTTRSVSLTDAGRRYLERTRRVLADVREADAAAQSERVEPTGRFVVTAPTMFGRLQVAPLLSRFLTRHPAVRGELLLTDQVVDLVGEGVDVAVRIGALADSSLIAKRVGSTRRLLVGSPRLSRPHDVIHLTALGAAPKGRVVFVTNSPDAAIGHAERGGGATHAFSYQVADALERGRLAVLGEQAPVPIHLVYPSARLPSAALRAFLELDWKL